MKIVETVDLHFPLKKNTDKHSQIKIMLPLKVQWLKCDIAIILMIN